MRSTVAGLVALTLASLACSLLPGSAPTATPLPTATASLEPTAETVATVPPAPTAALPAGSGPCTPTVDAAFDTYTRPWLTSDVFASLTPDFSPVSISSRTSDGWLGFDPGVPQAANIGVFRQRWIPPGAPITLSGDCASLPVEAWVPTAWICYQMSMGPTPVHSSADPTSAVSHTLMVEEFVAVKGRTGTGWLFVDGNDGNVPGVTGWIVELEMNVNGPCEMIPILTP